MSNKYCVIMAGGVGSRFWPLSRTNKPKQFLDILGIGESLLQSTYKRFRKIMPAENIIVVTNEDYGTHVKQQLPELPEVNILLEPSRRNTAPCIAYATYRIKKKNPNAVMVVAPSDHLIMRESEFLQQVEEGLRFVESNEALLTLGVKPDRPETGYGYIQFNGDSGLSFENSDYRKVKTFTEKPNLELARVFLESGDFYWNAGIFFWSVNSIIKSLEKFLPDVNTAFQNGMLIYESSEEPGFIKKTYALCSSISIDYAVMERADNVYVLGTDFGWSDLGTWGSLYDQISRDNSDNAIIGKNIFTYEVSNSLISVPENKLVVLQGLDNFIVVESDDILLVCEKEEEQRIKLFVNDIKLSNGDQYI